MTNKKSWLGILVMALVFGMTVVGCEIPEGDGGTFEFWIEHHHNANEIPITKVEFFNGGSINSPVLQTEEVFLKHNGISGNYKVSGFTEKYKDERDTYIFSVRLTLDDGTTSYNTSEAKTKSKIRIYFGPIGLFFDDGNYW
jgi:hypothetical protein